MTLVQRRELEAQATREAALLRRAIRSNLYYHRLDGTPLESQRLEPIWLPETFLLQELRELRKLEIPK